MCETSRDAVFSIGLADGKSVSREWNFDGYGRLIGKDAAESYWLPMESAKLRAKQVTSSNGD